MVFTKYDQFLRNVGIDLEDRHDQDQSINVSEGAKARSAKEIFEEHFLGPLGEGIPWVQMRGEFRIKYPGNILIFFGSYEQARGTLSHSYPGDGCGIRRRCRCLDACCCAEG